MSTIHILKHGRNCKLLDTKVVFFQFVKLAANRPGENVCTAEQHERLAFNPEWISSLVGLEVRLTSDRP